MGVLIQSFVTVAEFLFSVGLVVGTTWFLVGMHTNALAVTRKLVELTHKERMKVDRVYKYTFLVTVALSVVVALKLSIDVYGGW